MSSGSLDADFLQPSGEEDSPRLAGSALRNGANSQFPKIGGPKVEEKDGGLEKLRKDVVPEHTQKRLVLNEQNRHNTLQKPLPINETNPNQNSRSNSVSRTVD